MTGNIKGNAITVSLHIISYMQIFISLEDTVDIELGATVFNQVVDKIINILRPQWRVIMRWPAQLKVDNEI